MSQFKYSYLYFYISIFVTGAVILVIEIVGARVLTPFYGSTIYVWSAVITITLMALALGYFFGGHLADRYPHSLTLFVIIGLSGLAVLLIPFYANAMLLKTDSLGLRFGPLAACFFLFGPSIGLLGLVSPLMVKIASHSLKDLGVSVGNIYGLMTIGSLTGALLSGYYLAIYFSAKQIFFALAGVLLMLAFFGMLLSLAAKMRSTGKYIQVIAFAFAGLFIFSTGVFAQEGVHAHKKDFPVLKASRGTLEAQVVYRGPSLYGDIIVFDYVDYIRCLLVDGVNESCWNYVNVTPSTYTRNLKLLLMEMSRRQNIKDVLVIGVGAGTLLKDLDGSGFKIDGVEINPKTQKIAGKYFGLPQDLNYKIHIDDGRHYLRTTDKKYDAVVLDLCHVNRANVHLWTKEFYALVRKRLKDREKGFILASLGLVETEESQELQHKIVNAMHQSFDHVYMVKRDKEREGEFIMGVFMAGNSAVDTASIKEPAISPFVFDDSYGINNDEHLMQLLPLFMPAEQSIREQTINNFGKELLLPF